jgi:hypothetical protein
LPADTSHIIHANSPEEIDRAVAKLLAQATRKILLLGPRLDLPVFNSNESYDLLAGFIADDRHNLIRILVGDERFFLSKNRRLVQLCQRFSSYVKARRIPPDSDVAGELIVVIDDHAYLHQNHYDTPIAVANLDARGRAVVLTRRFEDQWGHSEPVPEISTLGLVGH